MYKINKGKWLIIVSVIIVCVLFVLLFCLFYPHLQIKNFKEEEQIEVFSNDYQQKIDICYGNLIKCEKIKYEVESNFNNQKVGDYKVKYKFNYHNKKKVITKKVRVVDTQKPILKIPDQDFIACPNGNLIEGNYQAIDNYNGDITDRIEYHIKNNKIKFSVKDSSQNTVSKTFDVKVEDIDAPNIILHGDTTVYLPLGSTYNELGYEANDICDGDLTEQVDVNNSVNVNQVGSYDITYHVSDSSKNEISVTRKVIVYNNVNNIVVPNGKTIYLTFDDGPGPYTAQLLDILNKYNVKATFFIIGTNSNYDYIIPRIYNEGHTLAMHSYTHNYGLIYSSKEAYFDDLNKLKNKIISLTGYTPNIIRFPGGSSNTISKRYSLGIMSLLTKEVEYQGYRYFDWNIASGDAGETTDTNQVIRNVTSALGNKNTYVVLQHDIKQFSVNAVEAIIQYGLAHGYHFAPITSSTPAVHHGVNN